MNEGLQRSKDKITQLSHWLELSKVIQYLKDHESEEGGFTFVRELYPNIEDTYYAIRILKLLKVDVDRNNMANYLKSINWKGVGFLRMVYLFLYLHLSLNIELPPQLIDLLGKDWSGFGTLDAQYYSDGIQKLLNQPLKPLRTLPSFQSSENLQGLHKKVSVLLDHGINFDKQGIIGWVQACQNGDGGFGFYPVTTSYMENIYCALEILSKLHASPMRIDTCREYILGCQTKSGGFGRAPISFPFIENTYHAVAGLLLLEVMEEGES